MRLDFGEDRCVRRRRVGGSGEAVEVVCGGTKKRRDLFIRARIGIDDERGGDREYVRVDIKGRKGSEGGIGEKE